MSKIEDLRVRAYGGDFTILKEKESYTGYDWSSVAYSLFCNISLRDIDTVIKNISAVFPNYSFKEIKNMWRKNAVSSRLTTALVLTCKYLCETNSVKDLFDE